MSLVWHVLPHFRMYTHQPVPEFYVASGDWLLWDRRRQQTQEIVASTGRWKGSQPYVCSGDGEIKTFEANVGAVHLFLTPNTESLVAGQECSVSIYLGTRYSAKARFIRTQEENGITQWITHQQTTVYDYWVLEIAVDGQVEASATIHQPSTGVTFAAGIQKANSASHTFYAWLSDGSNEHVLINSNFGTAPMAHFGSGTGFLSVDFDDAQQVEQPAKITVQGGAFISPLCYLINGFYDTVSLSPTTLESRQNDSHNTCHSMRQVSTNFLKPLFRNFLEDNGGQAETTRFSVNFQVSYLPNNLLNSGLYDDTLPYAHCIAGYKHAMSAPIPDSDGPPLHHLPETRTRLKVLRVTPQFRLRRFGSNTLYDVPSTDLQLVGGSFGDWAGSQEIAGVGNIKYLISIHWSEQPSNPTASLEEAALTTGSRVFFSHRINISEAGIWFLDYGDSPIFGGFSIGPSQRDLFESQQSQGNWFEAVRENFFNGEVIKFQALYTMFTVQAVGT